MLLCVALAAAVRCARAAFTCAAGDDPVQCAALGDLYAATNGAAWGDAPGWSAAAAGVPTSYCQFSYVACAGQAVTSVCVAAAALCDS